MTEKQCGNCKYFLTYYIKVKAYLRKSGGGQCICHDFLRHRYRPKYITDAACEFWSPEECAEEEQRKDIQAALFKMAERIEDIALMLKKE